MRPAGVTLRLVLLCAGALACTGCVAFSTVLTVKGDGSGTIRQRVLLTPEALGQIRGGVAQGSRFEPMSEQQARQMAASFGTGVTYLSSMPIDTSEGLGREVLYSFADINQLRLDEQPPILGVNPAGPDVGGAQVSFTFTHAPGGTAVLRLAVPRPNLRGTESLLANGSRVFPDQMAMFRQIFAGARVLFGVNVAGDVVRTSSPFVDGRRVTLVDFDIDDLLRDETSLVRLLAARTPEATGAALQDIPGVRVSVEPEITIEFQPDR